MIETFFNLRCMPFAKDIKPSDLLDTAPRQELVARLEHLHKHHGLFLLTGAPGTGKTTALRGWVDSLPDTSRLTASQSSSATSKPPSSTPPPPAGACPSSSSTTPTTCPPRPSSSSRCS
jgi:DNA transposition AAA+ family ATPase